ncbi:cation:proton antiporter [Acidianus sp. HS-5]|uniref:cation:proton antiporter domain-containing protein n=1 Tax=Acidianus sp. HS-5 TaxID=2886040 RepID=UPI001EFFF472|nr:cation:proton antiporter [Acidianus sp. HS-5]BDC18980.1 sodium:proton antiporter [Acidianus sp. HS-5]
MSLLIISLLYIGIMLILAKLMEEAFSRLKLVPFVGSIFLGIILGQGVLDFIKINEIISFITSLGIVFLLFLAGAEEIGLTDINTDKNVLFSSIIQLVMPFISIFILLLLFKIPDALLLAIPLGMTSVGPLTRLLIDLGISKEKTGVMIFYEGTVVEITSVIIFAIISNLSKNFILTAVEIIGIILGIFLLSPYIARILEKIEVYINAREVEFASIISLILLISFISEIFSFNSAISALFLGFLLRDYFKDRKDLLDKLHGFTYGFFEPLFFVSIGLYFTKINFSILTLGIIITLTIITSKFLAGLVSSIIVKTPRLINALGTSTKGGVDASLLISALSLSLINRVEYSFAALAISISALIIPLLFKATSGYNVKGKQKRNKVESKISSILPNFKYVTVSCDENLRSVIQKINELGVNVIIVCKEKKALGVVSTQELLEIEPSKYEILKVCNIELHEVVTLNEDAKIKELLNTFKEKEVPVIGILNKDGELVGTIYERDLLRLLLTLKI